MATRGIRAATNPNRILQTGAARHSFVAAASLLRRRGESRCPAPTTGCPIRPYIRCRYPGIWRDVLWLDATAPITAAMITKKTTSAQSRWRISMTILSAPARGGCSDGRRGCYPTSLTRRHHRPGGLADTKGRGRARGWSEVLIVERVPAMTTNSTPSGLWPALELSLPALEISRPESQHADEVSGTTESPGT